MIFDYFDQMGEGIEFLIAFGSIMGVLGFMIGLMIGVIVACLILSILVI